MLNGAYTYEYARDVIIGEKEYNVSACLEANGGLDTRAYASTYYYNTSYIFFCDSMYPNVVIIRSAVLEFTTKV